MKGTSKESAPAERFPPASTAQQTYVGGCRLSQGGLHLGHYYGSFYGIDAIPSQYFFVISDCTDVARKSRAAGLMEMAADLRSVAEMLPFPVHIVRESSLRFELLPIFSGTLQRCSRAEMEQVHPGVNRQAPAKFSGTMDDFLFPLHQASYLLGLKCGVACYNDDNSRFVDLTRRLSRRFNHAGNSFAEFGPHLLRRDPPRLLGSDLRRMAKAYDNCLPLTATAKTVRRFSEKLVGKSSDNDSDFDRQKASDLERVYARIFGDDDAISVMAACQGRERSMVLSSVISAFLEPVRRRGQEYLADRQNLLAGLEEDEQEALRVIRESKSTAGLPS